MFKDQTLWVYIHLIILAQLCSLFLYLSSSFRSGLIKKFKITDYFQENQVGFLGAYNQRVMRFFAGRGWV
jgi:hypothetical protein